MRIFKLEEELARQNVVGQAEGFRAESLYNNCAERATYHKEEVSVKEGQKYGRMLPSFLNCAKWYINVNYQKDTYPDA